VPAAPRPGVGARAEPGADGVVPDVLDGRLQVALVLDRPGLEAALEEVADSAVARVEGGRVGAVEALHSARQLRLAALDDEVEVVPHQAVRVHRPAERARETGEGHEEEAPIRVVHEDKAAVDATRGQVVDAVREEQSPQPGHGRRRYRCEPPKSPRGMRSCTTVANDTSAADASGASPRPRPEQTVPRDAERLSAAVSQRSHLSVAACADAVEPAAAGWGRAAGAQRRR
jgi:hypothetical protein